MIGCNHTHFITATDTDAGKTFLTSLLLTHLQQQQIDVVALKPVACGVDSGSTNPDVRHLQALQPEQDSINLHTTPRPVAPLFDRPITSQMLLPWCRQQIAQHQITLIEGVGGVMVPLADSFTQLDWIMALADLHLILVVRARLGSLSQLLVHLSLLHHRGLRNITVVVNTVEEHSTPFAHQAVEVVQQWYPMVMVATLSPDSVSPPAPLCQLATHIG
ncbi:MAG: dethiobiotin synthase [Mariprofundales bacterium]|nr:dethiobiotin synthase [Mariprofundales bacterium]